MLTCFFLSHACKEREKTCPKDILTCFFSLMHGEREKTCPEDMLTCFFSLSCMQGERNNMSRGYANMLFLSHARREKKTCPEDMLTCFLSCFALIFTLKINETNMELAICFYLLFFKYCWCLCFL